MAESLRKELKRPDQFVTTGRQWLKWGVEHQRTLAIAGAVLLAVLVAIAGVYSYREANQRQANADLAAALTVLQAERWAEAASRMQEVADRWGGGVGAAARLYAAQADIEAGNLDAARASLEAALSQGGLPGYLRQQAVFNLAYIAEQQGDTQAAAERYAEAVAAGGPYSGPALLAEARLRAELGDADAAKALYRRFLDENPDSPEAATIENRLSEL